MRLTKPALIKAIEPYIKKRYGEIQIERENVEPLRTALFAAFENVGCDIEEGIRAEKFVVFSLSKSGIKKYLDIPIIDVPITDNEVWDLDAIIQQMIGLAEKYGYDVFKDNKRSAALIGDVFVKYSNECRVMKMLFREGMSEVLGDIPYTNDRDLRNALRRIEVFMTGMGMGVNTVSNVKHIIKRSFVNYKVFEEEKEKAGRIHSSDFEAE